MVTLILIGIYITAAATAITNLKCVYVKSQKLRLFFSFLTSNRQTLYPQYKREHESIHSKDVSYIDICMYTICIKRAKLRVIYTRCAHVFIYICMWIVIAIALVFFDLLRTFIICTYVRTRDITYIYIYNTCDTRRNLTFFNSTE